MKCLRINDGKGEFSLNGVSFSPLDEIKKDDVLKIVDIALDPDQELEMDEYSADSFTNQAHKVIYENLYCKFAELITNKGQFVSEVEELYQEAYDKYKPQEITNDSEVRR
jgi:hypothetical protein